uniref:Spermidine synthase n=1 Tax=Phallusia mammillata TaxID=59560 RepID=A0A6F9DU64_9ASCI|nr:spermidine synthase [Phallusia mammillata]
MDELKVNWFSELNNLWPGQCMSLEVEEVLFHEKSRFQDVLVFKSKTYGNVLVLDGVIQCTERDEFSYQEAITHIPLFSHPNPRKVLVIGGGDGGVVREVLKHSCVESVTHCEIDQVVIEVSKKFLPTMSNCFNDPRVIQHIGDGVAFMEKHTNEFDVIITDSSDPEGPAEMLFEKPYYELMSKALRPGGVICAQGECVWLHLKLICKVKAFCESIFPSVAYAYSTMPTYPSGQIGYMLCSTSKEIEFSNPCRVITDEEVQSMSLRYYNYDVHKAAFILPQFAKRALETNCAESSGTYLANQGSDYED